MAKAIPNIIGATFFLVIGGYLISAGLDVNRAADETLSWPVVSAVVTEADYYEDRDDDGTSYIVKMRYGYEVGGRKFSGHEIYYHAVASFPREQEARRFIDEHPVGGEVSIHYNPQDPEQTVIYPGRTPEGYFLMIFGGFAWLMALLVGGGGVRRLIRGDAE